MKRLPRNLSMAGKAASARFYAWAPGPLTRLGRKQERAMMWTIELIWFIH
jgi:hypothetical protein